MNEIKTIGIIGSGKMGSDLFNYISDFNFNLIWFTRNAEQKEILRNAYQKKIKRQLKHGIISKQIFELKDKYRITDKIDDLKDCDLIIESILEDSDIKLDLFKKLDHIVKSSCVLASNSSSVLPSELSDIGRKNRVIGLHFFYPIAFKNVVEVISSEHTDDITKEKSKLFLEEIKRFYLEQDENGAFILNRFLLQLQVESLELVKNYGLGYKQFDQITKELIPEFGLFEMMDHVGHNTMYNAIMNYSKMDQDKLKYKNILDELKRRRQDFRDAYFFYDNDKDFIEISKKNEEEITAKLQEIANNYFKEYSYNINPFNLKKGLEEFCGIKL